MRKIIFFANTGYCGMEGTDNRTYSDDVSDETLNADSWDYAIQNAESYGVYPSEEYEDVDEDDYSYSYNIEGWWEDYDPEKHYGLACGEWKWE